MTTERISALPGTTGSAPGDGTPSRATAASWSPPAAAAAPGRAVPADGTRVTCPECGTVSVTSPGSRLASDFCPTCDYPLFWARQSATAAGGPDWSPDALRRAPGVAGTLSVATVACPSCRELNLPEATVCARCGALMRPVVVAPAPVPAPQPVVVVREEVACGHRPTWLVVTVTAVLSVALTIGATLLAEAYWPWS